MLRTFFNGSRLVAIPAQRKKKEIVFEEILRRLPRRKEYVKPGTVMIGEDGRYQLTERGRSVLLR